MKEWDHRSTWCEINLDNLNYNYNEIKKAVGEGIDLIPVIKADAYGHGAVECAKALISFGAKRFAVAIVDEGIQLRKAGVTCPILVLGYISEQSIQQLFKWELTPTVYSKIFAKKLSEDANRKIKIHIKIDTGMGRLGFRGISDSIKVIEEIHHLNNIEIEGIYSHFAIADEIDKKFSYKQIEIFNEVVQELEKRDINISLKHLANSAAIIDLPDSYYNCVRPGIMLYGLYPSKEVNKFIINLKPVKTFKTTVANIKVINKGDSVSYGRKYIAQDRRVIATLPVGYADGYSRLLSNKCEVLIKDKRAQIVGRICMDQCMADVTHINNVKVGDEVIIYGEGLAIEEIADKIDTINYEITCMTKERVPKLYFLQKKLIKVDNYLTD
ncbi:MAG: alanine racemase [Eubacteriaceae bacterium]